MPSWEKFIADSGVSFSQCVRRGREGAAERCESSRIMKEYVSAAYGREETRAPRILCGSRARVAE